MKLPYTHATHIDLDELKRKWSGFKDMELNVLLADIANGAPGDPISVELSHEIVEELHRRGLPPLGFDSFGPGNTF
jgi:hypothetical protein